MRIHDSRMKVRGEFFFGAFPLNMLSGVVLSVLLAPQIVLAASGGVPSIVDTIPYWINFLVFVAVLGFIVRKPFLSYWAERTEKIAAAVNAGRDAELAAQAELEAQREKHASLDAEVQQLARRIEEEGKTEAERLVAEAHQRAKAIMTRAQEGIIAERANLESRLRDEVATEVLRKAESIVRGRLDERADRELRRRVLGEVQELVQ
ncbi:ATP synthase F0 subunit B [bacterium]|nr:ATP synthase F0 subunit B [bacterium]